MNRRFFAVVVSVLLASFVAAGRAQAAHDDIVILAGQSNMDGRGNTSDLTGPLEKWTHPQASLGRSGTIRW